MMVTKRPPLPIGTRVRGAWQRYSKAMVKGTATIVAVTRHYPQDGTYEYTVRDDEGVEHSWNHVVKVD